MKFGAVRLKDVERAVQQLGGEATWKDILNQVSENRNSDYSHYKDFHNFCEATRQVKMNHCPGYAKYKGVEIFEKLPGRIFRLVENRRQNQIDLSTPIAFDIGEPSKPDRVKQENYRILRDTELSRSIKNENEYKCQICGTTLTIKDGKPYAEAHHIKPLGNPHNGPDVRDNILCVCPNHHVLLDYGAIKLDIKKLEGVKKIYIDYHNQNIWGKA